WASCCANGSHVFVFLRMLGLGDFAMGIFSALPFLANAAQVFGSVEVERSGVRKYQFMSLALIQRFLWMAVAAVPLVLPVAVATDVFSPNAELTGSIL